MLQFLMLRLQYFYEIVFVKVRKKIKLVMVKLSEQFRFAMLYSDM